METRLALQHSLVPADVRFARQNASKERVEPEDDKAHKAEKLLSLDWREMRELDLNQKQHEKLKEVVEIHRQELLANPIQSNGHYDSYEFSLSSDAGWDPNPRVEKKAGLGGRHSDRCRFLEQVPGKFHEAPEPRSDALQPLSLVRCTKQPTPPSDDDNREPPRIKPEVVSPPQRVSLTVPLPPQRSTLPPNFSVGAPFAEASTADESGAAGAAEADADERASELSESAEKGRQRPNLSTSKTTLEPDAKSTAAANLKLAQERRNGFDTCIGILVLLNAFVMVLDLECQGNESGFESGIISQNAWSGFASAIVVLEHCFAIAFLLELLYRVATEGRKYFHEAMNIFDTALVLIACVDLYILTPLVSSSNFNNTSSLRILRTVKLVNS
eukprot:Skav213695  [mRNA]  locus=scaffold491:645150:650620:- [translate_table: standard]